MSTGKVRRLIEWARKVLTMPYPADESAADALRRVSVATDSSLAKFKNFIAFVGLKWGRFGSEIRAAQDTMAEAYGVSNKTVRRWLKAAVQLGMLRLVKEATGDGEVNVYEINEWWLMQEPVPTASATVAVVDPAPMREEEPGLDPAPSPHGGASFRLAPLVTSAGSIAELDQLEEENKDQWSDELKMLADEQRRLLVA